MKKIISFIAILLIQFSLVSQVTVSSTVKIPTQTGNSGKVLGTNGSVLSWVSAASSTLFITPEMYGAIGNGVTNDNVAFTSCINAASISKKAILLSNKTYSITGLTISDSITIIGMGYKTILATSSNTPIISITGSYNNISGIHFKGNSTGTSQDGINATGVVGLTSYRIFNKIENCYGENLGGSFVYGKYMVGTDDGNNHEGSFLLNNCIAKSCLNGFFFDERSEYNALNGCKSFSCTTGLKIFGGNNNFTGGMITGCETGVLLGTGANDCHGLISSTSINHNTINVSALNVANGMMFNGCALYAGNISVVTSTNIAFSDCLLGGTMTITSTNNSKTKFNNCDFQTAFTLNLAGRQPLFNNCKFSTIPSNVLSVGGDKVDYSSTSKVIGWSSTTTKLIKYWAVGKTLFVSFDIEGTSNATTASITIPFGQSGETNTAKFTSIYAVNNGTVMSAGGAAQINGVSTTINFFTSMGVGVWSNIGTKRVIGLIAIELEN